jgi:hypothetical protein
LTGVTQVSLWRVYQPQWLAVYTSDLTGHEGTGETIDFLAGEYGGRVRDEDVRISIPDPDSSAALRVTGSVRLPNLQGEWKNWADAEKQCGELGEGAVVVGAGSAEEAALHDYGRKRLLDA